MLGANDEICCNAWVPVHSVATVDCVSDVLYRAMIEEKTAVEWEERGRDARAFGLHL